MRILYHHRIRSKDGQFVHLEEMVKSFRNLGHQVRISGPRAIETSDFGSDAGLVQWLKRILPLALYEVIELTYCFWDYIRLRRDIREFQPDIIYERYNLYFISGTWAKHRFGIPLLLEVNAPVFDERLKYDGLGLKRLARWTERFAWKNADRILSVTQVLADMVIESANIDPKHVSVIQNAINYDTFETAPSNNDAKQQLGLNGQLIVGFIGFVRDWHGLDRVVNMLPKLPKVHLLVVGDGPALPKLQEQVASMALEQRVTLAGFVDRAEVGNYLAAFDIALQPNVVPYASPLKVFEYMVMGKPILAPRMANIQEILQDGTNALLFDVDSDTGFTLALDRLVNDAELRKRLGREAFESLRTHDLNWDANAKRVIKYASALMS